MGLEIPTGKTPGTVVRSSPAPRPAVVGAMILGLFAVQMIYLVLIAMALYEDAIADPDDPTKPGANSAAGYDPAISEWSGQYLGGFEPFTSEQTIISFWISMTFFCLFGMIFLYQRYFKDHVTITKRRFRKWEDEGVQLHG